MKVQLLIPLTLLLCIALVLFINSRQVQLEKEGKRGTFVDIKLRVNTDVLQEYKRDDAEMSNKLNEAEAQQKTLEEEVKASEAAVDKAKQDRDGCQGEQKSSTDELATLEAEYNNLKAETDKAVESWNTEKATLNEKLAKESPVCAFVKVQSDMAKKLCGERAKAEAPKEEEAKAEAPKEEEAKAEAPK